MEQITVMLLIVWAAAIAAIATIVSVKGFSRPTAHIAATVAVETSSVAIQEAPVAQLSEPAQTAAPIVEPVSIVAEPISAPTVAIAPTEAPPPFPEDSHPTSSTSIPIDITAVTNIASPTEIAAPALVVPLPKRRTRSTKRLPGEPGATRRKRTPKAKPVVETPTTIETVGTPGQQQEYTATNNQA